MNQVTGTEKLVNQPSVETGPHKGSRQYCDLVTKRVGGDPFIRKVKVGNHYYWQRCRYVYVDGKRKLKILEHLGNRKPRGV